MMACGAINQLQEKQENDMDDTHDNEFGRTLVDELRCELELPYDDCVEASSVVLDQLLRYMQSHQLQSLESTLIMRLRQTAISSQQTMNKAEARRSWDYKAATQLIEGLESYRKGSGNRERCWPGGTFSSDIDGQDGPEGLTPAGYLSRLSLAFKQANPQVIYHVIEYPGRDSADEFKLLEVLADELQWHLQRSESTHGNPFEDLTVHDIGELLMNSVVIHEQALAMISHNPTVRSVIFRILRNTIATRNTETGTSSKGSIKILSKLAAAILSSLHDDVVFMQELDGRVLEDDFLEIEPCLQELITLVSSKSVGDMRDQLVALVCATNSMQHPNLTTSRSTSTGAGHGSFFCVLLNSVATSSKDELAQYLVQTVLEWWNYHSNGSSGLKLQKEFGLLNSCVMVAAFLTDLVAVKIRPTSTGTDIGSVMEYFTVSVPLEDGGTLSHDDFYLIGDGDCEIVLEMCRRMLVDCDPSDKVYDIASSLQDAVTVIRFSCKNS